jgi:DNA-binding NtrC family response regulator
MISLILIGENKMKNYINLDLPILITGETGTGKSKMAKKIYNESIIFKKKFILLNLATIKEDLIESELFGHKKGSFTGAIDNKEGFLKAADGGTLFLDEIGELSLESQKKLLMLLEEGIYFQIGDTNPILFKGRIIMATNQNLKEMVLRNQFREDLFYRINTFNINLPRLNDLHENERWELIQRSFWEKFESRNKKMHFISQELKKTLITYSWPGNFRELKNVMEYLSVVANKREVETSSLPNHMLLCLRNDSQKNISQSLEDQLIFKFKDLCFKESMAFFEALYLKHALIQNKGKINETALKIGLSKVSLISKSKKYKINATKLREEEKEKELHLVA